MTSKNTLIFVGAIHGNEPAGVRGFAKFQRKIEKLKLDLSPLKIKFILGNPKGFKRKERYIDENLNRVFGQIRTDNYESQRARKIEKLIYAQKDQVLAVLDLHSVSVGDVKMSFAYHNHEGVHLAKCIYPTPLHIYMRDDDLSGTLTQFCGKVGISSIAIECGNHSSKLAQDFAYLQIVTAVKHFLQELNPHLNFTTSKTYKFLTSEIETFSQKFPVQNPSFYLVKKRIDATSGFQWKIKEPSTEDYIPKGMVYAKDHQGEHKHNEDGYLLIPDRKPRIGDIGIAFLAQRV